MNRRLSIVITALLFVPMVLFSQTYQALWKEVQAVQDSDHPQTAIKLLQQIEQKAAKEKSYGNLLKSTLLHASLQFEVSPDSLASSVERIEQDERNATDVVLKSVYAAVLAKIYHSNSIVLEDESGVKYHTYRDRALAHPTELAQVKTEPYLPFVVVGVDSKLFGNDLLSVVGMEMEAWDWMARYYEQVGNRPAACLSVLNTVSTIEQMDSLIAIYGDLPEACEIAINRYNLMREKYTAGQKAAWLQESMRRWGDWKRVKVLKNAWDDLVNPVFNAKIVNRVAEVNKPQTVALTGLRHLESLTMNVYRTRLEGDTELNPSVEQDYEKIKSGMTELKELCQTVTFTGHEEWDVFEDSLTLEGLPAGVYLLEFMSMPKTDVIRHLYYVSSVRTMMQAEPAVKTRYVVVDATTGQPFSNAKLRLSFNRGWGEPKETRILDCNAQGETFFVLETERPSDIFAYTPTDKYCPPMNASGQYSYYDRKYSGEHTTLLTDRSIYRPGQTVHVTAVVWKELSMTECAAVSDKQIRIELRDTKYKLVSEQQVTTDRFGKCSASFTLPMGLLNGSFTVRAHNGSTKIKVEEYKRPTFQVEFPEYKESYQKGDTVHAQAKAVTYSGVPVQDAKVKYTVRRQVAYWWMAYSWYWSVGYYGRGLQNEVVSEGETKTGEDGTFTVDMPMVLPDDLGRRPMFYHFVVEADVTDVAGETHSGTMTLPLGNKPTALTCDMPQQVRIDQLPKVTFSRRNAAGKEIAGQVKYRINQGKWQTCAANTPASILKAPLQSGSYSLQAVCEADTVNLSFVVFGLNDQKPASQTDDWFYVSHKEFPSDGSPVTIQVGSSDPDLHIVYGIYSNNDLVERGAVKRSAALVNRKFTYKEEYGSGLLVTYAWVKNGKCHTHQTFLRRPVPEKQLKMTWETFRDRLTPGQQEEWKLKITKPDGTPAEASLAAVLYDKSLDAIYPHQWSFVPGISIPRPYTGWQCQSWGELAFSGTKWMYAQSVNPLEYSHFDEDIFPSRFSSYMNRNTRLLARAVPAVESETRMVGAVAKPDLVMQKAGEATDEGAEKNEKKVTKEEPKKEEVQVRENLNETAFCYPALETDAQGNVSLKFTLPECLTTWRFMGVSNTVDMLYGYIDGEAIAQKDVMVQPNVPRFVRQGDEAQVSTRIFNTSDHAVSGTAVMSLTDPETGQVVFEQEKPFSVEAGKTGAATFSVQTSSLPAKSTLLVCKIVARGDGFSDGEQHYLPILPNREYVTKTVSYTQNEPGVKSVDLTKLFPAGTDMQKLTVEYTNNPVWLMVQSLSLLGQPWERSAIDLAASYYSNLLAKTLIDQNPQVKTTFELWRQEKGSETSLMSNLRKNQELKDLVLSETPWVVAADREEEQKQRLVDFFDENLINNRLSTAVEKLGKLQNANGSFSWYPGMGGSIWITVAVEEMLVRLTAMVGEQADIKQIQNKAFDYLGNEMVELVHEMKKAEKKGYKPTFPSFNALRWLYVCAIDGRKLSNKVRSANDYLINLLKKETKRQTIYEKALTAVILSKHGEAKKAADYVKSLKEYTVFTEEMGRYYDSPRATYSWYDYKIPTEVAAIEAIQTVAPDDRKTVDEMRRWLLQEKRTQAWGTPINSVNAIHAFLGNTGSANPLTPLDAAGQTVLAIDGQPLELPTPTAGMGYVKTAVSDPKGVAFTATKTSEGTSWGAVYAQFMQKTSEIEALKSGVSVKREIINITPDAKPNTLSVGDRVKVRITIETTRDLDFVQVVDRRAACMEPVRQLSGYQNGAYCSPKDHVTHYFYNGISKGKHVIETEYYIDRAGHYETGTCTVGCAYSPEFRGTAPSLVLEVGK